MLCVKRLMNKFRRSRNSLARVVMGEPLTEIEITSFIMYLVHAFARGVPTLRGGSSTCRYLRRPRAEVSMPKALCLARMWTYHPLRCP